MSKPVQIKQRTQFTARGKVLTQEIKVLGLKVVETFDDSCSDLYAARVTIEAKATKGLVFRAMADGRLVCLHSYMSVVYIDIECALRNAERSEDRAVLAAYLDRFCAIRAQVKARDYVVK